MGDAARDTNAQLVEHLTSLLTSPVTGLQGVPRTLLVDEVRRLVQRTEDLARGELNWLSLSEAWELLARVWASEAIAYGTFVLRCDELRRLNAALASQSILVLREWLDEPQGCPGASLQLLFDADNHLARDAESLDLALNARRNGWSVSVGEGAARTALVSVHLTTTNGEVVSLVTERAAGETDGLTSMIRFVPKESSGADKLSEPTQLARRRVSDLQELTLPSDVRREEVESSPVTDRLLSVTDLFGDFIVLRDLEPRTPELSGIGVFRSELGWDPVYIPRKNEREYATALVRIMRDIPPEAPDYIIYVGDTLLNDGGAIRGLQDEQLRGGVWGFLCGATPAQSEDFVLGDVYFGARWNSLVPFLERATTGGLRLGSTTCALFDLDQTVYAAKGRDDEPLLGARWDAVRRYLEEIIPAYKFDAQRAQALYREFDRDEYHPVTRDNMDYVVLLILAVASGLADGSEIANYAQSSQPSIGALAEELRRRASIRVGHEDIGAVLEAIRAIHYNTLAGDQTPCKDFRRFECLSMAERMNGTASPDDRDRIFMNREVVDLLEYLLSTGTRLMAVSDRPVEAATVDADDEASGLPVDLMSIRMGVRGMPISTALGPMATHDRAPDARTSPKNS
jgi:hypothetical protein